MKHFLFALSTLLIGISQCHAYVPVDLSFDAGVPGTIADVNGLGTGFTHRLPGTGAAIPIPDPNSNLLSAAGYLTLTATPGLIGGFGGGVDLPNANLPGVLLSGINNTNFEVEAKFDDVVIPNHQLAIYVGTRSDLSIRAGFHGNQQMYLAANLNGAGDFGWSNGSNSFAAGDDIVVRLRRNNGLWSISWDNLTNPALSGSSLTSGMGSGSGGAETAFPELNAESDLYVGVMNSSHPAGPPVSTALVDYFRITVAPEPSAFILGFVGMGGLLMVRTSRRNSGMRRGAIGHSATAARED